MLPLQSIRENVPEEGELWLATPAAAALFRAQALSDAERERYARLSSERRRRDFAASRALLTHLGEAPAALTSLSHSREHACVLRKPGAFALGADLEWHARRNVLALARFAFSPQEAEQLARFDETGRTRLFYSLWVLKEAAAKALRLPLLDALRRCTFALEDTTLIGELPTSTPWSAYLFAPREDFSLGIVMLGSWRWPRPRLAEWPVRASGAWPQPFAVLTRSASV